MKLLQAVLSGDHTVRGFRKADIRQQLDSESADAQAAARRRHADAVSRLLKRLHVRGLIAKIPRTRRWRTTTLGESLLGAIVRLHDHGLLLAT